MKVILIKTEIQTSRSELEWLEVDSTTVCTLITLRRSRPYSRCTNSLVDWYKMYREAVNDVLLHVCKPWDLMLASDCPALLRSIIAEHALKSTSCHARLLCCSCTSQLWLCHCVAGSSV